MQIIDQLTSEHNDLREKISALRTELAKNDPAKLSEKLTALQNAVRNHFHREDIFFKVLDNDKRLDDRGAMHQVRNDHAAIIFGLESLAIRLRKNGPIPDWRIRLENLLGILLPHLAQEEQFIFPQSLRVLTPTEIETIQSELDRGA